MISEVEKLRKREINSKRQKEIVKCHFLIILLADFPIIALFSLKLFHKSVNYIKNDKVFRKRKENRLKRKIIFLRRSVERCMQFSIHCLTGLMPHRRARVCAHTTELGSSLWLFLLCLNRFSLATNRVNACFCFVLFASAACSINETNHWRRLLHSHGFSTSPNQFYTWSKCTPQKENKNSYEQKTMQNIQKILRMTINECRPNKRQRISNIFLCSP